MHQFEYHYLKNKCSHNLHSKLNVNLKSNSIQSLVSHRVVECVARVIVFESLESFQYGLSVLEII